MGRRGECSRIAGQHRGGTTRGFAWGTTVVGRRGSWTSFTVHRVRAIKDGDAATGSTRHAALLSPRLGRAGATVSWRGRVLGAAKVLASWAASCVGRLVALAVGGHSAGASS